MIDNRTTELLPCPFCGGAASFRLYYGGRYRVHCNECGCHLDGLFDTEAEASADWNNRPKHVVGELVVNIHPMKKAPSINVLLAQFGYHYAATTSTIEMAALVDSYADRIREAIAATLGGGECECDGTINWEWTGPTTYYEHELSCGHVITSVDKEPPNFCEECGARIRKKADE